MSDVDIGRVVGFESPRTSRWKHGQIAVVDSARLLALSQSFDIDICVLSHVAAGYLSTGDALKILSDEDKLCRFLGEQMVLSADQQAFSLTSGDTVYRISRRSAGHYHRRAKRIGKGVRGTAEDDVVALLADDEKSTIEAFENLTGSDVGIDGVVARSGAEALVVAGRIRPQLIIVDLFLGGVDGFAALRSLTTDEATQGAEVFATSRSLTPDMVRAALGCGAVEVLQRPLRSRVLNRLLGRLRRG